MSADVSDLFVGREAETALLSGKLSETVRGDGHVVLISGEAGIGKTHLLHWLRERAKEQNVEVLFGRCREMTGAPPFWPWLSALSNMFGADSDIIARLAGHGDSRDFEELSEAAQFRLFDTFSTAFRELTSDSATVLILEDMHWADAASLKLLEFVSPDIATLPVLLVCSFRDAGVDDGHLLPATAGQIARETHASRIELARFGRPEIEALFSGMSNVATSADLNYDLIDVTLRRTNGNPLFAVETLRLLDAEGFLTPDARPDTTDENLGVPSGVAEAVTRRVSNIPQSSVEVLQNAAVLGSEFTLSLLSMMSAMDASDLLSRMDPLVSSGVLVQDSSDGTMFRFSHALVRDAIADRLTVSDRACRHNVAATAIEKMATGDITTYAGTLAHHYRECRALTGNEPAIRYSMIAGEQAISVYSYEDAKRYFQNVVDLSEGRSMDEELARAHFGLARSFSLTLAGTERLSVVNALETAFEYGLSSGVMDLAVQVATFPMNQHVTFRERYHRLIEKAQDLVAPDSIEAGYVQNNLGHVIHFATGDFKRANETLRTAISIGASHGDVNLQALAVSNLLEVRHHHNLHDEDDLGLALEGAELARQANNPDAEAKNLRVAAYSARERDMTAEAISYAERGLEAAERFRHGNGILYAIMCLEDMMLLRGDWNRFRKLNDRALEIDPNNTVILAGRHMIEQFTGSPKDEVTFFDRILKVAVGGPEEDYYARVNAGMAAATTCDRVRERAPIAIKFARDVMSMPELPRRAELQARGILAYVALNERASELGNDVLEWMVARPDMLKGERIVPRIIARLEALTGKADSGVNRIAPIYAEIAKSEAKLDHPLVCCEYAEILIERGSSDDLRHAEKLLSEVDDVIESYGIHGLYSRVEKLRSSIGSDAVAGSEGTVPAGLTNREIEVLRLVSHGLSNPEIASHLFISRHTVVRHISNIFSKTGVSSRSEATAFAVRNGID